MRVVPAEIQISGLFLIRIMMRAILTFLGNDATVAVVWRFLKPMGNVEWHKHKHSIFVL